MLISDAGVDTKAANVAFGYCSQNGTAYCDVVPDFNVLQCLFTFK